MEVPGRYDFDRQFTEKFDRLSAKHRRELIRLLGNPPDPRNVPQEFWDKVEEETREQILALLLLLFMTSFDFHGGNRLPDGEHTGRIEGQRWAGDRSNRLSQLYTQTSQKELDRISRKWVEQADPDHPFPQQIGEWTGEAGTSGQQRPKPLDPFATPEPIEELNQATTTAKAREELLDQQLQVIFGESRASGVAETAITTAQTYGGEFSMGLAGLTSADDLWINKPHRSATGPCRICRPLHLQPRSVWQAEWPDGPGSPHPRCVCVLRYANSIVPIEDLV